MHGLAATVPDDAVSPAPTFGRPDYGTPPPDMPIPDRLNALLVLVVFSTNLSLLWLASHVASLWAVVGIGVVFSYVMLTNYALLHEAAHGNLASSVRWNDALGVLTGLLFPIPFRLMRTTHQNHHLHNRSEHEMFDIYEPADNRLIKNVQWYGLLCGFFWPFVPVGALLFALFPGLFAGRMVKQLRPERGMGIVANLERSAVRIIRWEVLLIIAFFAAAFWLLDLYWLPTLILYACFSFNWSTRQYVGHAFSPRDVIDGAWNLRHNRLMSGILLHGEWDLNHHRRPEISWYYLPRLETPAETQRSYLQQYWRLWRGPRPVAEIPVDHGIRK